MKERMKNLRKIMRNLATPGDIKMQIANQAIQLMHTTSRLNPAFFFAVPDMIFTCVSMRLLVRSAEQSHRLNISAAAAEADVFK